MVCSGLGFRILMHDTIRDILAIEIKKVGYQGKIDKNGGSGMGGTPGNILLYR